MNTSTLVVGANAYLGMYHDVDGDGDGGDHQVSIYVLHYLNMVQ